MKGFYFHKRLADGDTPAGYTVSKKSELPNGDFRITEYKWPDANLWFVDEDEFDADERQDVYLSYKNEELNYELRRLHKISGGK